MSFMSDNYLTIHDRLEDILDSINLIQEWSDGRSTVNDFMGTSTGVMAFNACVMRFQGAWDQMFLHVGKESTHQRWYNGTLVHFE